MKFTFEFRPSFNFSIITTCKEEFCCPISFIVFFICIIVGNNFLCLKLDFTYSINLMMLSSLLPNREQKGLKRQFNEGKPDLKHVMMS